MYLNLVPYPVVSACTWIIELSLQVLFLYHQSCLSGTSHSGPTDLIWDISLSKDAVLTADMTPLHLKNPLYNSLFSVTFPSLAGSSPSLFYLTNFPTISNLSQADSLSPVQDVTTGVDGL